MTEKCACGKTLDAHEDGFGGSGCPDGSGFFREVRVTTRMTAEREAEIRQNPAVNAGRIPIERIAQELLAELDAERKAHADTKTEVERLTFLHKMIRGELEVPYGEPVPGEMEPVMRAAFEAKARITLLEKERAEEKTQLRDALQDVRRGCNNPNCECSAAIANRIIDSILKETA